jgi:hypothetical protein
LFASAALYVQKLLHLRRSWQEKGSKNRVVPEKKPINQYKSP